MKLYDVEQGKDSEAEAKDVDFTPDFEKKNTSKFADFVVWLTVQ